MTDCASSAVRWAVEWRNRFGRCANKLPVNRGRVTAKGREEPSLRFSMTTAIKCTFRGMNQPNVNLSNVALRPVSMRYLRTLYRLSLVYIYIYIYGHSRNAEAGTQSASGGTAYQISWKLYTHKSYRVHLAPSFVHYSFMENSSWPRTIKWRSPDESRASDSESPSAVTDRIRCCPAA